MDKPYNMSSNIVMLRDAGLCPKVSWQCRRLWQEQVPQAVCALCRSGVPDDFGDLLLRIVLGPRNLWYTSSASFPPAVLSTRTHVAHGCPLRAWL